MAVSLWEDSVVTTQRNQATLEALRTVDAHYEDNRTLTELEHRCVIWLLQYADEFFVEFGRSWDTVVFRQSYRGYMLVVKTTYEGTPQVAFVSGRNPADCARVFACQWFQGSVEWNRDKYR